MLHALEELSVLTITGIVAAIILAAVLIYALVQQPGARRRSIVRGLSEADSDPGSASAGKVSMTELPNPRTLGKVRAGREGNRLSEDDIVREHMRARGRPGEPATSPPLDESITQIPKAVDPGHTA